MRQALRAILCHGIILPFPRVSRFAIPELPLKQAPYAPTVDRVRTGQGLNRTRVSRILLSMNTIHSRCLRSFVRRLSLLLMVRAAVRSATAWFFLWGVVILAARIAGTLHSAWLVSGLLGAIPLAAVAAFVAWRRRPPYSAMRAEYDRLNACGGVIMSEELADTTAWQSHASAPSLPRLRWRSSKSIGPFALSALFVAVALVLPERLGAIISGGHLEVGQLVAELQAEVQTLEEEKIVDEQKANELEAQLERLKEQSSGTDPNRTWEALDHIKESNSELARQAAEEALAKMTALNQSEALASALETAAESGLGKDTATRAAQDLAAMLKAAKLEEGLLNADIPADLLSGLDGLDRASMEALLRSIRFNKAKLGQAATNLANLKLIDAKLLAACKKAGECPGCEGLAAFLCESGAECDSFSSVAVSYCRGGVNRGRGDAPMTWTDPSAEEGAKFKEEVLPPSSRLSDAQLVGVSRAAPDLSGDEVQVEHGALASAEASGGAGRSQLVLPRHQATVRRFFAREE